MSVYQRNDGRWVCKVKDTSRRPAKWVQRTFKTKEEADEFNDEATQEERQCARLTVYEAVGLYLNDHTLSPWVESQYRWLVGGTSSPHAKKRVGYAECIAERYVDSLTRQDLNDVRDNARRGGCINATVNLWVQKLQAVFNYIAREDLIHLNPWAKYGNLPQEHKARSGTLEQLHALFPHLPEWLQWASKTALALCLRPGIEELFRLKWSAFDFMRGVVTVWMPKVKTSKTVYPIPVYLTEAQERFKRDGQDRERYVCRNSFGRTVHDYDHMWRKSARRAGLEPFPMYALRHIAATQMLAAGADVAAVAANLGHASPQTTLETYAHALPQAQRQASTLLGAAWCSPALPEPAKTGS